MRASFRGERDLLLYNIRSMQNGSLRRMNRRRRLARKKTNWLARVRTAFLLLSAVGILGVVVPFASFAHTYTAAADDLPRLDDYSSTELAQTSVVYDVNGNVVDELYGVQNR